MQTKTWPLGTIKAVEVLSREVVKPKRPSHRRDRQSLFIEVLTLADVKRPGEAFVLTHAGWHPQLKPGDRGIITCTAGGPTGQYWLFTPHAKDA